jgi:Flp pilus assembly protein CpaB
MNRLALVLRRTRRAVLARRRPLAACCAGLAVAAALQANAAPPPATTTVLVAAHDIAGGVVVRPNDLTEQQFAPDSVPSGVVAKPADAVGRTTVAPVRQGEPLTDVRLLQASLLDGYPGLVAAPVRIGDPGAVRLLRVGDHVDVMAADPQGGTATVLARDTPVVAIPGGAETGSSLVSGALVVLAVSDRTAQTLAAAGVTSYLSFTITR